MTVLIELTDVTKSFKGMTVLNNLSISFERGEIHGIVGPNGSGKSVLFKLMCGFSFPDSGRIAVDGHTLRDQYRFPENFGVIIDRPGYMPNKTGLENLQELASIRGKIDNEQIMKTLRTLQLDHAANMKVKNYSLGMKQKLALCQAIMEHQTTLILDEPFNALDIDSVKLVRELLLQLKAEGRTIFLTSHNAHDLAHVCDRVYRLNNGTLAPMDKAELAAYM